MKDYKRFRPRIRTKNHTASGLRPKNKMTKLVPYRSIVRLGSTTENEQVFSRAEMARGFKEINSTNAVRTSSNKLSMKQAFKDKNVKQSEWWTLNEFRNLEEVPYPILAKKVRGSKARGMVKIENKQELDNFMNNNNLDGYYFEKFHNYAREYRIHMSIASGEFMAWRKLRRKDEEIRWYFNNDNCNWVNPEHELFDRPNNWNEVVDNCKRALEAVGLDIGACDVRIQSNEKRNPEFIICEINSAPSLGDKGVEVYANEIFNVSEIKPLIYR